MIREFDRAVQAMCITGLVAMSFPCATLGEEYSAAGYDPAAVEIPSISDTAPRPVTSMDLLGLRDFHGVAISPDGKWVAFVLGQAVYDSNSYRSGLFVVSTAKGGRPINMGTAGPPHWDDVGQWVPEAPQWSPESDAIYYRLKTSGTWQVWKWPRANRVPVQVTHLESDVLSFEVGEDGDVLRLIAQKPITVDKRRLSHNGVLYQFDVLAGRPKPFLDQTAEGPVRETESWIHDLRSAQERPATAAEQAIHSPSDSRPRAPTFSKKEIEEQEILIAKLSPDGTSVAYQPTLSDPSKSPWTSYPLFWRPTRDGTPVNLTPGLYYIDDFWWSPNGKEIVYTVYDAATSGDARPSKVLAVSPASGKRRVVFESPGVALNYSIDRSQRHLACTHESTTRPAELELIDLTTAAARLLVNVNPEFDNLRLAPAQRFDVKNKYGDHFWSHLVLPLNYTPGTRYPLVITTYRDGDAFLRGGAGDEYPIQVFAANGLAVLNFDIGTNRNTKPGDFATSTLFWASPIDGMETAIAKLSDMGLIDPDRVAITGLSHGAEMVKYGISHTSAFRAAIASSPVWDPIGYYLVSDSYRKLEFAGWLYMASPDGESRERWQQISPALNAAHIRTPLLMNDADEEYLYDLQLATNLRELGRPVEMYVYVNEFHIKNQPRHRYEIYERNVEWLRFWLNGQQDPNQAKRDPYKPDAEKADQYKRWRELRELRDSGLTAH